MSIKVYTKIDGKLAMWEVHTSNHREALMAVASALPQGTPRALLAVIEGGKDVRAEVAA